MEFVKKSHQSFYISFDSNEGSSSLAIEADSNNNKNKKEFVQRNIVDR